MSEANPSPDDPDDLFDRDGPAEMFDAFLGGIASSSTAARVFRAVGHKKERGRPRGRLGPTSLAIRDHVLNTLVGSYDRMTVRQAFYRLEVASVVEKTEAAYVQVQRQLLRMRREGELPWDFITDGTRWRRKPDTYDTVLDYVEHMARGYRRDLWAAQGLRIEIWLEKDALADVIVDVTAKWDVSLMVSRGQSSATFLHNAAKEAERAHKAAGIKTVVYTMYDYDAAGERAHDAIARDLPSHAPGVPIQIERLAVTPGQITALNLPTRPPKKKDPQAKKWGNKPAVELDAIPPNLLVSMVETAIERHVNKRAWDVQQKIEAEEREGLAALRAHFHSDQMTDETEDTK